MLMYIDDDHINVMRMGPRDMKPEWPCEIRTLTYDGTTAKLILPAPICKAFSLKVGDELKLRIGGKSNGTEFIMLKPARPTLRIRIVILLMIRKTHRDILTERFIQQAGPPNPVFRIFNQNTTHETF